MKNYTLSFVCMAIVFVLSYANSCVAGMQKIQVRHVWDRTYATACPKWAHIDAHITFDKKKQQVTIGLGVDYKKDPLNKNVGHCSYATIPLQYPQKFYEATNEHFNTSLSQFSDISFTTYVYHIDSRSGSRVLIDKYSNTQPTAQRALWHMGAFTNYKYHALYLRPKPSVTQPYIYGLSTLLGGVTLLSLYKYLRT